MKLTQDKTVDRLQGLISYIPNRLLVEKRSELSIFPLNFLMARYGPHEGKHCMINTLYEPDLSSFRLNEDKSLTMNYFNRNDHRYYLKMIIGPNFKFRKAEKYKNEKKLGETYGIIEFRKEQESWNKFFAHLAVLGFDQGEGCLFDPLS